MTRTGKIVVGSLVALLAVGAGYCASTSTLGPPVAAGATVGSLRAFDGGGVLHELDATRGSPVVVFFYPRDETPGCTTEACAFRDRWTQFTDRGVKLFGVSGGTRAGKAAFAEKQSLPFPLLVDDDLSWAKAFGVRVVFGVPERISFLLDREGRVVRVYPDVDPAVHAERVLADVDNLLGGAQR
jgi:thioredoxin-dependent peroxiredoxin